MTFCLCVTLNLCMSRSGEVLLTLLNDVLDLSKIEAGKLELDFQIFDVRQCVEAALDVLANQAANKR